MSAAGTELAGYRLDRNGLWGEVRATLPTALPRDGYSTEARDVSADVGGENSATISGGNPGST